MFSTSIQPTETVLTSSELIDSFSTVQPTEMLSTSSLPIETVLTSSESTDSSSSVQPTEILFTSSLPIEASSVHFPLSSGVMPHQTNVLPEPCGSGGGWTRLAYLDMSNATQNCPSGFKLYQSGGVRTCGRPATSSGGCVSVQFPSNGISYSQICGRVTGYQYGSTDAVSESVNNINSHYLDGVSITRGSPRQHVWSLYAAISSDYNNSINICPCAGGTSPQSFVGNNYFCEAGIPGTQIAQILYTSDPLWDGQGCDSLESPCCNVPGIPWFHRDYGSTTTTDYIELRVCGDEGTNNDDAPVSYYEIYIK
uniref:Fibrinogen C-terminal domain-containing protein n=1 Tax=Amphimedon queenslandica TaxID=400682 RepID=A0A1X7SG18_AMPQE